MTEYRYHLLDVFTTQAFGGNPLAVFPDGNCMSSELMQSLANELNLSETVFVLSPADPTHDFKLRIFTPLKEIPMAGHPTVGTGYLLAHLGMVTVDNEPTLVNLEENVGLIPITIYPETPMRVVMQQLLPIFDPPIDDYESIARLVNLTTDDLVSSLPIQVVSTGVRFLYVPVQNLEAIRRTQINMDVYDALDPILDDVGGVYLFTLETVNAQSTVHSRMYAPKYGIAEDPATGSASGPLGCYLVTYGLSDGTAIINEQGFEMGRESIIGIDITTDADEITGVQISGNSVYLGSGSFQL